MRLKRKSLNTSKLVVKALMAKVLQKDKGYMQVVK
jgi:hypothetical protein